MNNTRYFMEKIIKITFLNFKYKNYYKKKQKYVKIPTFNNFWPGVEGEV